MRGVPPKNIALDVLDLITIVVPPALPYAMAVGIIVGVERLSRKGIFCISPRSVNLAGLLDIVCFDKVSDAKVSQRPAVVLLSGRRRLGCMTQSGVWLRRV